MNEWRVTISKPRPEQPRLVYTVGEDEGLQVTTVPGERALSFRCHDDFCGDSLTGIGASVSYQLSADEVRTLHASLGAWLARKETT